MSIATSSNFYSNAIVGQPMAGSDIDVLERHSAARFSVGFGFTRSDGNCFRYVQYGDVVLAGVLVGNVQTNTNLASTDALVVAPATAVAVNGDPASIRPGSVGSRYVEIILATVAANQFAGGYLAITKDTGIGYTYRIRGNTATNNPATGNLRIELYERIKVALDNTSDIAIAASKYVNLTAYAAVEGTTSNVVGVAMCLVSNNDYGWVCTKGRVGALCKTTNTGIGNVAVVSLTSGSYQQMATITTLAYQRIGTTVVKCVDAQMGIIDLLLE